jgi:hypothetical protein
MILFYTIINKRTDSICKLYFSSITNTRGNSYELYQTQAYYDLRIYLFTYRVTNIWNSLPDKVFFSDNINTFKNRLDRFSQDQDVFHDGMPKLFLLEAPLEIIK